MPTTTSAVQICSLVLESDECMVTLLIQIFLHKNALEAPCTLDPNFL